MDDCLLWAAFIFGLYFPTVKVMGWATLWAILSQAFVLSLGPMLLFLNYFRQKWLF
jgi:hypothetical protein